MSKFRDQLKETAKNIILSENLLAPVSRYRLAVCSAINDDGTCLATVDGNEVTAFPLYPIVLGQNIMLIFGDIAGKVSAVPLRPAVPAPDLIHPPFYTGGNFRTATIHQLGGVLPLPTSPVTTIDFQDMGSMNVYRLSFPDLDTTVWKLITSTASTGFAAANLPGVTFSADGTRICVAFYDSTASSTSIGQYKLRKYLIGAKLQSNNVVISQDDNLFGMEATLEDEYTTSFNAKVELPAAITGQFVSFYEYRFPYDTFISSDNKLYWMEVYSMPAFALGADPGFPPPQYLFQLPPAGILEESLCTIYYIKRLDPGGVATLISVILATYEPGPTAFQNYSQFSPVGILDIDEDLNIVRVYGMLSLSGGLPYSTLAVAIMDKLPNPTWVTSSGSWLTLNQTPVTQYQSSYTTSYTNSMRIIQKFLSPSLSTFYFEDIGSVPIQARMVVQTRGKVNPPVTELLFPTFPPVTVDPAAAGASFVMKSLSLGFEVDQSLITSPQRWKANVFGVSIAGGTTVTKSANPLVFTPQYQKPDDKNMASVGWATSGFGPVVVYTAF